MRILVGYTKSGRAVEVPIEQDERADWLLSRFTELEQRHEVYCVLAYLRAREDTGWRLTAADRGDRFFELLHNLFGDPSTQAALELARRLGIAKTTFDDLELGRQLVLAWLRG